MALVPCGVLITTAQLTCPTSPQGETLRKTQRPWKNLRNLYSKRDSKWKTSLYERYMVRTGLSLPLLSPLCHCHLSVPPNHVCLCASVSSLCLVSLSLICCFLSVRVPCVSVVSPSLPQGHNVTFCASVPRGPHGPPSLLFFCPLSPLLSLYPWSLHCTFKVLSLLPGLPGPAPVLAAGGSELRCDGVLYRAFLTPGLLLVSTEHCVPESD